MNEEIERLQNPATRNDDEKMLNLDSDSDEQQGENTATSSPALAKFLLKTDNTSNMNNYARIYLNYTSIDLEMMCSGHELR